MSDVQDTELAKAEVERLQAETRKFESEREKAALETQEIQRRLRRRWFLRGFLLQAVIGGAVAAGLLVAWVTAFFGPMIEAKTNLSEIEVKKLAAQNELERLRNLAARQELEAKLTALSQQYTQLTTQYGALARSFDLSEAERERFAELSTRAASQVDSLQQQLDSLRTAPIEQAPPAAVSPRPSTEELATIKREYERILTQKVSKIRVVVHVVHSNDTENISDEQIHSQFETLNRDFGGQGLGIEQVPDPFKPHIGDARTEFVLAQTDPAGNPTAGITRTRTTRAPFQPRYVKSSRTGGIDPWDPQRYLNIWVCSLSDGLVGVSQFPGGPPETDGVVVLNRAFGTTDTASAPFDGGRTATSSIAKYFGLRNIWGDTPDCSGSDLVADTPTQRGPNFGKPSFPHVSCNNGPHGDMFMNFLDYVDDSAKSMFTKGQVVRMHSALAGPRKGVVLR